MYATVRLELGDDEANRGRFAMKPEIYCFHLFPFQ